jgi:hypothetical protein
VYLSQHQQFEKEDMKWGKQDYELMSKHLRINSPFCTLSITLFIIHLVPGGYDK